MLPLQDIIVLSCQCMRKLHLSQKTKIQIQAFRERHLIFKIPNEIPDLFPDLFQLTVVLVSNGTLEEYQFLVVLADENCIGFKSDSFFTWPKPSKGCKRCVNSEKRKSKKNKVQILHRSNLMSFSVWKWTIHTFISLPVTLFYSEALSSASLTLFYVSLLGYKLNIR